MWPRRCSSGPRDERRRASPASGGAPTRACSRPTEDVRRRESELNRHVNNLGQHLPGHGALQGGEPSNAATSRSIERVLAPTIRKRRCRCAIWRRPPGRGELRRRKPLYQRAAGDPRKGAGADSRRRVEPVSSPGCCRIQGQYVEAGSCIAPCSPSTKRSMGRTIRMSRAPSQHSATRSVGGKVRRRQPLYERALTIREKRTARQPAGVVQPGDLAWLLHKQGQYATPNRLYRRVLAIREKTYGPDNPGIASVLSSSAMPSSREATTQRQTALRAGAGDPRESERRDSVSAAASVADLAWLLKKQGQYAEAELSYRRVLSARERVDGPVIQSRERAHGPAGVLQAKGDGRGGEAPVRFRPHHSGEGQRPESIAARCRVRFWRGCWWKTGGMTDRRHVSPASSRSMKSSMARPTLRRRRGA